MISHSNVYWRYSYAIGMAVNLTLSEEQAALLAPILAQISAQSLGLAMRTTVLLHLLATEMPIFWTKEGPKQLIFH